ncbi:MAG: histidine phosphatase family protein [Lactobacillaceae bacterium]|nr:histidine phosphatase family protein [Lactobacillaceae bacterium]
MAFKLFLVRHGQTIFNKYERMQGWSDAPLTEAGIADGYAAGERLANVKFDAAFSSDLSRAIHTAEFILAENKQQTGLVAPTQLKQFREQFFGYFEGLNSGRATKHIAQAVNVEGVETYSELMEVLSQDKVMDAMKLADPTHDAEDANEFWTRLGQGFKIIEDSVEDGQTVLLVAHGSMIRNLADRYAAHDIAKEKPLNGSVSVWQVDETGLHLETYNDTTTVW